MNRSAAEILREYGPLSWCRPCARVTYDGQQVWFASGDKLNAFDPATGNTLRSIDVAAHAGTAFDGEHLFQIAEDRIQKIDPKSGRVLATIPAPGGGGDSGLAWAEGTLWVGQHRGRKIHQVDPQTGAIPIGVSWTDRFVRPSKRCISSGSADAGAMRTGWPAGAGRAGLPAEDAASKGHAALARICATR